MIWWPWVLVLCGVSGILGFIICAILVIAAKGVYGEEEF